MEGWKDVHVLRQVQRICRGVWPSLYDVIRPVKLHHELGDVIITVLHIFTAPVESRQEYPIAHLVRNFGATASISVESLLRLSEEHVILGLHDVRVDTLD